jgi:hypothetical protein
MYFIQSPQLILFLNRFVLLRLLAYSYNNSNNKDFIIISPVGNPIKEIDSKMGLT